MKRRQFIMSAAGIPFYLPILEGLLSPAELKAQANDPLPYLITFKNSCGRSKNFWQESDGAVTSSSLAGTSLDPLKGYAGKLLLLDRLQHAISNNKSNRCSHGIASSILLTGGDFNQGGANGQETAKVESLDYYADKQFGNTGDLLYIQTGKLDGKTPKVSWKGNGKEVDRINNPYVTYETLFGAPKKGGGAASTGTTAGPDTTSLLKKSVLDTILPQINALKANNRLSADDARRLQQHYDAVRSYETKLASIGGGTSPAGKGKVLKDATIDQIIAQNGKNGNQWGEQELIAQLHMESVALAIATGARRVATLAMGVSIDMTKYRIEGKDRDFHATSHQGEFKDGDNNARYGILTAVDKFFATQFAYLLARLEEVPYGGKTLLDYGVTQWLCDMGPHAHEWSAGDGGQGHDQQNLMFVVAGSANGILQQGKKIDLNNRVNNCYLASVGAAIGLKNTNGQGTMTSFHAAEGKAAAQATDSGGKGQDFNSRIPEIFAKQPA